MVDVTVVILTRNEEINLPDCLKSCRAFAKRIVIIDSGSTDRTIEIAREHGADVYVHEFEYHAKQFNWALDNIEINTKWVFRLDADERLTKPLCDELEKMVLVHDKDEVNGITMEAWLYFMGRKMKHGCRNKRKLMMFKKGTARIEDRKIDEHTLLLSGYSISAKEKFIHYDFKDMTHWISKMNWYASREMRDYIEYTQGKKTEISHNDDAAISATRKKKFGVYYKFPMFIRSWLLFIYFYIFKLGFLDGKEGFLYNYFYHRWYRCLVDAKIYEYKKTGKEFEILSCMK